MNERVLECKVEERVDSLTNKQENGIKGRERRKQKKDKQRKVRKIVEENKKVC